MYPENDDDALDKRSTKKARVVIGDDVDAAVDASPADRGSAQLGVSVCFCSSAATGTYGRPSAVETGPICGYKRKQAVESMEAVAADCAAAKRTEGPSSGSCEMRGSYWLKILKSDAEKCSSEERCVNESLVLKIHESKLKTGGVKLKVVRVGYHFVPVSVTEMETPTAGDFEEAVQIPDGQEA